MSEACDHSGHRGRMKEKFLRNGLKGFEPHEIIEMLLYYSVPRANTNAVAHALYNKFGSVAEMLEASHEELLSVEGMGRESAIMFKFLRELSGEYLKQSTKIGEDMDDPKKIGEFFAAKFFGQTEEIMYALCLDSGMHMISCVEMPGEKGDNELFSRRLVETVVREDAASVVLAHNHPAGRPMPSRNDSDMTVYTRRRLAAIGITLIDHIIVGKNNSFLSLRECGVFALESARMV